MRKLLITSSVSVLSAVVIAGSATAQDTDQDTDTETAEQIESSEDETSDEARQDKIVVTGSRLIFDDPTARVDVITADDISKKGLATAEDIVRSLPQNLSTLNSSTSVYAVQGGDLGLGNTGVGISTANLFGLGSANTLVLLNGKRMAGIPGQEDFVANIRNIPASAIERVEVNLDGGGAVYGSDAIAGVINIVTKRGYTGGQASARYETSSTGGDLSRFSGYLGRNWGSGSVSATLSYIEQDPVLSEKAGFVTRDYRDVYPDFADADFRNEQSPRSGGVAPAATWFFGPQLILPIGNDGTDTTEDDFQAIVLPDDLNDVIDLDLTPATEDLSINLFFEQTLFSGFTARADLAYSETKSVFRQNSAGTNAIYYVPDTNAFNPFGEGVYVFYSAEQEVLDGLIPAIENTADSELFQYSIGFDYDISDNLRWVMDYSRSKADRDAIAHTLQSVTISTTDDDEDRLARIRAALASSDPDIAINLFGDGTAQNEAFSDLYGPEFSDSGSSVSEQVTTYFTGSLFDMAGGDVGFAFGGEWRQEKLTGDIRQSRVENPSRDIYAVFGEVLLPVIGDGNALPGVQSLTLTLDARYDEYDYTGPLGTDDETGEFIETSTSFDRISPRIGAAWQPVDDLLIRASWAEGFKAPVFSDLFSIQGVSSIPFAFDPLIGEYLFGVTQTYSPNQNLKPEISETISIGMDYSPSAVPNLNLVLNYADTSISDRVASLNELFQLLPFEEIGAISEIYIRDETGRLLELDNKPINIAASDSETLEFQATYGYDSKAWGWFEPGINVQYVLDRTEQATETSDVVSQVGLSNGVDEYKLRAWLQWRKDNWDAYLEVAHTPEYENIVYAASELEFITLKDVSSRTTVDTSLAYKFDAGWTLRGGVRNLFDEDFPSGIFAGGRPFDANRVDTRGRVAFLEATYDFSGLVN